MSDRVLNIYCSGRYFLDLPCKSARHCNLPTCHYNKWLKSSSFHMGQEIPYFLNSVLLNLCHFLKGCSRDLENENVSKEKLCVKPFQISNEVYLWWKWWKGITKRTYIFITYRGVSSHKTRWSISSSYGEVLLSWWHDGSKKGRNWKCLRRNKEWIDYA